MIGILYNIAIIFNGNTTGSHLIHQAAPEPQALVRPCVAPAPATQRSESNSQVCLFLPRKNVRFAQGNICLTPFLILMMMMMFDD